MALALLSGFLYKKSIVLGLIVSALAVLVVYLNLPMALILKQVSLGRRPLSRVVLVFWIAVFSVVNLPRAALVHLNNYITGNLAVEPEQAHVLVSRCLQCSDCQCKVTVDINNCQECGRCKIGALKRICLERSVSATVESGGTSARKQLREKFPRLVVAVACERELLAGIMDTRLPVVGVMIKTGAQPCTDSDVAIPDFEERINCCTIKEE